MLNAACSILYEGEATVNTTVERLFWRAGLCCNIVGLTISRNINISYSVYLCRISTVRHVVLTQGRPWLSPKAIPFCTYDKAYLRVKYGCGIALNTITTPHEVGADYARICDGAILSSIKII